MGRSWTYIVHMFLCTCFFLDYHYVKKDFLYIFVFVCICVKFLCKGIKVRYKRITCKEGNWLMMGRKMRRKQTEHSILFCMSRKFLKIIQKCIHILSIPLAGFSQTELSHIITHRKTRTSPGWPKLRFSSS